MFSYQIVNNEKVFFLCSVSIVNHGKVFFIYFFIYLFGYDM